MKSFLAFNLNLYSIKVLFFSCFGDVYDKYEVHNVE